MSDKMNIDSANAAFSRDPRLASRPTKPPILRDPSLGKPRPGALGSPDTPRPAVLPQSTEPTPPEKQDTGIPDGSFIQAVSELVQASVASAISQSEKDRLWKRKDTTEGLLKKAKVHTNFPSTAAFFQQANNDENIDLTRMDDAVKEHLSNCNQIQKDLITKWGSLSPSNSKTEHAINSLQNELQAGKADAASTKAEIARLMDTGPSRTGPLKILQDRVIFLEKTLGNQTSVLNEQRKNTKANDDRLASVSSEAKKAATQPPAQAGMSTQVRIDIDDLKRKYTTMDSNVKSLVAFKENISKSLDKIYGDIGHQREQLTSVSVDSLEATTRRLNAFNGKLSSLENNMARNSTAQATNEDTDLKGMLKNLELRLKALEGNPITPRQINDPGNHETQALNLRIEELSHLQAMKDDMQFSEMEDMKQMLTQQTKEFKALKDDCGRVSEEVKNITQANPSAALQQVQSLSGSLLSTQRVVESVKVALHSLETRYNNISTEPIVKNMVVAMQEMYPSASQLTEQVSILRNHFEKDLLPLKSRVEHVIRSHSSHVAQMQKDSGLRMEELNRLKTDHARVEQSLSGLWEQFNAKGSWPVQQDSNKLQSSFEPLSRRLDEHISRVGEQLKSKQTSDESLVRSLNHEREHVNKEIRGISTELRGLIRKFAEVESSNASNAEATKTQWNDIGSLLDRMGNMEESASHNHDQLLEQFDNIKKAVESQEARSLHERLQESEAQSPPQKVEGEEEQEEGTETPANGDNMVSTLAETSPALALREKKKKKRARPSNLSNLSDDERPSKARSNSPRVSTPGGEETPLLDGKKRAKKKRKRRLQQDTEPITLD